MTECPCGISALDCTYHRAVGRTVRKPISARGVGDPDLTSNIWNKTVCGLPIACNVYDDIPQFLRVARNVYRYAKEQAVPESHLYPLRQAIIDAQALLGAL